MLVLAVSGGQASADTNAAQRLATHTPQLVQAGDELSAAVDRGTISPAKAAMAGSRESRIPITAADIRRSASSSNE